MILVVVPGLLSGMTSLLVLPVLPNAWLLILFSILTMIGFGLGLVCVKKLFLQNLLVFLSAFLFGIIWFSIMAHQRLKQNLPANIENIPLTVEGKIVSLPILIQNELQFQFILEKVCEKNECRPFHLTVLLNWLNPPGNVKIGQIWQLPVKLKRPHTYANPGSFDREAWLLQNGIRATGAVYPVKQGSPARLITDRWHLASIRQYYDRQLLTVLSQLPFAGVIDALTVGNSAAISQQQWQIFRNTGTSHLIAISGLHIGMIAGLFYLIGKWLWRCQPRLCESLPAQKAGAVLGIFGAFSYTAFSGFSIPAERTLIMIITWMMSILISRHSLLLQRFMLGLGCVLMINPFSVMNSGFWLSFSAIAIIGYGMSGRLSDKIVYPSRMVLQRGAGERGEGVYTEYMTDAEQKLAGMPVLTTASRPKGVRAMDGPNPPCNNAVESFLRGIWWRFGRVQWVATIGLMPLSWLLFQQSSIVGLVANLIAIPWVGLVTVPVALLGCIVLPINAYSGHFLLWLAEKTLEWLWPYLHYLASFPDNSWFLGFDTPWLILPLIIAVLLFLAPIGFPARGLSLIWFLPALLARPGKLPENALKLTVLDVGQGLSIIMETRSHVAVYDTGVGYPDGYNMGDVVLLPFFRAVHITHLDKLIISHGDSDHSGGAPAIFQQFPGVMLLTSVPKRFEKQNAVACQIGQGWSWDGVRFNMLYPFPGQSPADNNRSCVLQIQVGNKKVLLPGDIEKPAEKELFLRYQQQLASFLLVAPHHGSSTSSSPDFIQAVDPSITIFATGYLNRYHFPVDKVVERYRTLGSQLYNTAYDGAISVTFIADQPVEVHTYRKDFPRFWWV